MEAYKIVGFCVIAALMGFSLAAYAEDVEKSKPILPPLKYDYYPAGGFRVFTVQPSILAEFCKGHEGFPSCSPGLDQNGACVIFALPREDLPALGYAYDDVKRHEFGHCNGWPSDHPGMRSAADDTSPEKCSCFRTEEKTIQCNGACNQAAGPDIVAALRKRFPDLQGSAAVFDTFIDGNHDYVVAFGTTSGTMSCLALN